MDIGWDTHWDTAERVFCRVSYDSHEAQWFTPRDRYTFPICGYIRIVNVPAQVARAQEGSLLRRLECLSCPCSG